MRETEIVTELNAVHQNNFVKYVEGNLRALSHSIPDAGEQNEKIKPDLRIAHINRKPRLSILGLGYVGAVSSACFCNMGYQVMGVDPNLEKVQRINRGESPIVEKDVSEMLYESHRTDKLYATVDTVAAVMDTDITLVSVGTPSNKEGACDLRYLREASEQIAEALRKKSAYHLIVYRSTVPPRTTRDIMIPILEQGSGKCSGKDFGVCFNPEFLRESTAVDDFYHPPITVLGAIDKRSLDYASKLYSEVSAELIGTSLEAAEFVKYVDNTWHALKVTFGNEIGRICKAAHVDSHDVMNIFLKDTKLNISSYYLKPGFAFGGSCLPKDTRGIKHLADELNVEAPLIGNINKSNDCHIEHAVRLIVDVASKKVGVVGITFKAGTDDLRESPALLVIKRLMSMGYQVNFYDPCVNTDSLLDMDPVMNLKLKAACCDSAEQLIDCSDTLVITHQEPYANEVLESVKNKQNVVDVVRLPDDLCKGKNYQGICW